MNKILVTGATGHLGKAVLEYLLKKTNAANLSVLIRKPEKAAEFRDMGVAVKTGDYSDTIKLQEAFKGVDKIYLVSGSDLANRAAQHKNVIEQAKAAGVKQIVYTSFQRKSDANPALGDLATSHLATEQTLKDSGLIYTILQHGMYSEIVPVFAGPQLLESGKLIYPAGDGRISYALRNDLAEAGATILLDESGRFNNRVLELAGSTLTTWSQLAGYISEATGSSITYISPSEDEYIAAITKAGLPAEFIHILSGFGKAMREGEFSHISGELEMVLERKPVGIREYLETEFITAAGHAH